MKAEPFPSAHCALCRRWEACYPARIGESVSPGRCFDYRREVDLAAVRSHFDRLRGEAGLGAEPFLEMERRLIEHLAGAMRRFSFCLEFSFSLDYGRASAYRFSYSFPAYGLGEAEPEAAALKRIVAPLGGDAAGHYAKLLELADPAAIRHILFGIDARPGKIRFKLYYQFPQDRARAKLALLRRLLPVEALKPSPEPYRSLHLVGVDFGPSGVSRVKLYFLHPLIAARALRERFPEAGFIRHLLDGPCPEGLKDFLVIRRLKAGGIDEGPPVAEVDFGLVPNGLTLSDLARYYRGTAFDAELARFQKLLAGHHTAVSRVSLPPHDYKKLNLYYLLLDPPGGNG